ncbi:MAG TPA: type IX secretion system protein PorQ, partial [Cyclobacteriaceae bacterium]
MQKKYSIGVLAVFLSFQGVAQFGGQHSFEFLNVPGHARLAGLGGVNVSLNDRDVNFFLSNPALVGDSLSGSASAGYQFYVADIGMATFAYSQDFKTIGSVSFGVQHMNYGEITGYDASGVETGSFKSGETALMISKSHQVSNFRMGANLKTVFSNIAGYRASALLIDIGGTFIHPTQDLTLGLVFKNLGFVLSEYSEFSNSKVPFDVQMGATFKPEHMPVRFSLAAYNIATKGNAYDDPNDEDDPSSFDKFLGHINIG